MYENPLMKKKIFLFVTEFLCGIALMGVETAANRLLAPYFSSSQVVWTIIIGAILIAMAIGNYLGGRFADKVKDVTLLYVLMLAAGSYICLIPFIGRYVIAGVTAIFALIVNSGLIIWSTIFVCFVLIMPPLVILGMVTPSLIKYTMGQQASGKIVGILESLNTAGSIIGTFIPIFITIPTMGTSYTFALFGGLICLVSIIFILTGFINDKRMRKLEAVSVEDNNPENSSKTQRFSVKKYVLSLVASIVAVAGIVLSSFSKFVFWDDKEVIYEDESIYNYLQVKEDNYAYYFSTNVLFTVQSMIKKDMSLTGMYYDYCLSAAYMANIDTKTNFNVLVLGNGTGTYATLLKHHVPYNTTITGVEIDQKIIDLSYQYFMMPDDIYMVCDDGRNFLNLNKDKYDLIMVDAYSSISTPFTMSTVEFFSSVKGHLKDDGVMVMNINMYDKQAYSLDVALCDTVCDSFSNVITYQVPGASGDEVFASNNPNMLDNLKRGISICNNAPVKNAMSMVNSGHKVHVDTGIRLLDDNSDVELRSMNSIDGIIEENLAFYRRIYKERGLKGLLDYLLG